MRKRNKGKSFARPKHQRVAMFNSMAGSLFLHGKIQTTEMKAKELRTVAEKFITKAKGGSMSNRKLLAESLAPTILKKLIDDVAPQYKDRKGGYTRIMKTGPRKSDGAKMAIIELIK